MAKKQTMTKQEIIEELYVLDQMVQALNNTVVALAYAMKVKPTVLDKVKPEDLVKFVQDTIHPIVRKSEEISKELADKTASEAKKAVE